MLFRVLAFYVSQAFYNVRALFGYNVVLLTDPRWVDPLATTLDELEF
jgi:hypothetical protein